MAKELLSSFFCSCKKDSVLEEEENPKITWSELRCASYLERTGRFRICDREKMIGYLWEESSALWKLQCSSDLYRSISIELGKAKEFPTRKKGFVRFIQSAERISWICKFLPTFPQEDMDLARNLLPIEPRSCFSFETGEIYPRTSNSFYTFEAFCTCSPSEGSHSELVEYFEQSIVGSIDRFRHLFWSNKNLRISLYNWPSQVVEFLNSLLSSVLGPWYAYGEISFPQASVFFEPKIELKKSAPHVQVGRNLPNPDVVLVFKGEKEIPVCTKENVYVFLRTIFGFGAC